MFLTVGALKVIGQLALAAFVALSALVVLALKTVDGLNVRVAGLEAELLAERNRRHSLEDRVDGLRRHLDRQPTQPHTYTHTPARPEPAGAARAADLVLVRGA